jgi:integron integrase
VVPLSPSSCSLAQRFSPYIRLLVTLVRGNDFLNGTPKNLRMEPHPRKAQNPPSDLRIGSSTRPAPPPPPVPQDAPHAPSDLSNQPPTPRLLDRLRTEIRVRHYSIRTESAYVDWARRFILFHHKRHPQDMGAAEVEAFLTWLAVERNVAASTQNQAKSALLFLFGQVLKLELPWLDEVTTARTQRKLPVVLTPSEVRALLLEMSGVAGLVAALLYGTGMRLMEGLRLRVKDVEFERRELIVRDGKGGKDRVTVLPENLMLPLRDHMAHRKGVHEADLRDVKRPGLGSVWLPSALALKYPNAPRAWGWQWVFASPTVSSDPRSGVLRRHHLYEQSVQKAVSIAAKRAGINKPCTPHVLRHYLPFLTMS